MASPKVKIVWRCGVAALLPKFTVAKNLELDLLLEGHGAMKVQVRVTRRYVFRNEMLYREVDAFIIRCRAAARSRYTQMAHSKSHKRQIVCMEPNWD